MSAAAERSPSAAAPLRFLFALWASAGAISVEARLIAQLIARGHRVTVLAPSTISWQLDGVGCEFIAESAMSDYDSRVDYPENEMLWVRDNVWFGGAAAQARAIIEHASATAADVIVCESPLFAAMAGAEATGLPSVLLCTSVYARASDNARAFWDAGLDSLNSARAAVGLSPIPSVLDQEAAMDRVLVLSIEELGDDSSPLPAHGRYVGPPPEPPAQSLELPGDGDLVLISFSTGNMAQTAVLQRVADAVAQLPLRAVLTLGPAVNRGDLSLASNIAMYEHLPHAAVLPAASATITHAGHGTVMAALTHGVPLMLMPMGRDQHLVAERVAARHAGIIVSATSEPDVIASELERLLKAASYREQARELGKAIRRTQRANLAVHELEALGRRNAVRHGA